VDALRAGLGARWLDLIGTIHPGLRDLLASHGAIGSRVGLRCGFGRSDRPPAGSIVRMAAKQIISRKISRRVFSSQTRKGRVGYSDSSVALTIATRRYRGIDDERRKPSARSLGRYREHRGRAACFGSPETQPCSSSVRMIRWFVLTPFG
jgi:hypothetical protein